MIIQNAQQLQQLQANISNMDIDQLKAVQIHIEGRLVFPNLTEARAPKSNPAGRKTYGAVLIFPMAQVPAITNVGMNAIAMITNRFKQMYHAQVPDRNYIKCYKNFQENPVQDNGGAHPDFYKDSWWVNTSSGEKHQPAIWKKVNGVLTKVLPNDPDLYFGQKVIFVVSMYPTGTDPKKPEVRKGTSANILAILILGGGERIAGTSQPEVDPNASFSAFANMTADFNGGSVNHFDSGSSQATQGFGNNQSYTPPPSNNGGFNGGGQQNSQQSNNPFGGQSNFNNGQNNGGNNPFGGGLI